MSVSDQHNIKPNITLISNQQDVIDALVTEKQSNFNLNITTTISPLLSEANDQTKTGLVIYDIQSVNNDASQVIKDIVKIKQQDPTKVFILIGDKEPLSEVLKSHIQPAIYRAFNKPVSANQLILSFNSGNALHNDLVNKRQQGIDISIIGPETNNTNIDSLSNEKNNKPVVIGLVALVLIVPAILFFASSDDEQEAIITVTQTKQRVIENTEQTSLDHSNKTITKLNKKAKMAILEDRLISPKGDNALYYYNQVLQIDPYDITAYDGKKVISDNLRSSFGKLLKEKKFDKALSIINVLTKIEPLNIANDEMHRGLQNAISNHIKQVKQRGDDTEINKTIAILEKIESGFDDSKSTIHALKIEKDFLNKIDQAFIAKNLTPPKKGNAYSLISEALKNNKVSKDKLDPRIIKLANKLVISATNMVKTKNLKGANKLASLVKKLHVNKEGLDKLSLLINEKTSKESIVAKKEKDKQVTKIIPAKVVKRTNPQYPRKAQDKKVEGWVDVGFTINTQGNVQNIIVNKSEPGNVFDKSAIKAIKKWKFSPARNEQTGLPVNSKIDSVKLSFKLN